MTEYTDPFLNTLLLGKTLSPNACLTSLFTCLMKRKEFFTFLSFLALCTVFCLFRAKELALLPSRFGIFRGGKKLS